MSLIDWKVVLDDHDLSVTFSSLEIPEVRDAFEKNVAEIRLPRGYVIDVAWQPESHCYVISVFPVEGDAILNEVECASPYEVVEQVKRLKSIYSRDLIPRSSSSPGKSSELIYA
jgi:hypothetical protein